MVFIWKRSRKLSGFELTLVNKPGALASVADVIRDYGLNIYYLEILSLEKASSKLLLVIDMENEKLSEDEILSRIKNTEHVISADKSPEYKDIIYPSEYRRFAFENRRYILFPEANIAGLIRGLKEKLGEEGGRTFLFHIGERVGVKMHEIYSVPLGIKEVSEGLELISALWRGAGWGDILSYEANGSEALIRIKDLWECEMQKGLVSEPSGDYSRGILAGYFKSLLNKRSVMVREEKCIAIGNEHCEFLIRW